MSCRLFFLGRPPKSHLDSPHQSFWKKKGKWDWTLLRHKCMSLCGCWLNLFYTTAVGRQLTEFNGRPKEIKKVTNKLFDCGVAGRPPRVPIKPVWTISMMFDDGLADGSVGSGLPTPAGRASDRHGIVSLHRSCSASIQFGPSSKLKESKFKWITI